MLQYVQGYRYLRYAVCATTVLTDCNILRSLILPNSSAMSAAVHSASFFNVVSACALIRSQAKEKSPRLAANINGVQPFSSAQFTSMSGASSKSPTYDG